MIRRIDRYLDHLTGLERKGLYFAITLLIGVPDLLTGYAVSFSVFYLAPIAAAVWYDGAKTGYVLSAVATLLSLAIYASTYPTQVEFVLAFWNAMVKASYFLIGAKLVSLVHTNLAEKQSLAERDGLTGLMNSRTFQDQADGYFSLMARQHHATSLAYIDLDGFKSINDTLGHDIGDAVLKEVAATLLKHTRSSDLTGRLGGDEFALLMPATDEAGALEVLVKLKNILDSTMAERGWAVSFSIGAAVFNNFAPSAKTAIRTADLIMYKIKRSRKNDILVETVEQQSEANFR